jgi:hypothetical protein
VATGSAPISLASTCPCKLVFDAVLNSDKLRLQPVPARLAGVRPTSPDDVSLWFTIPLLCQAAPVLQRSKAALSFCFRRGCPPHLAAAALFYSAVRIRLSAFTSHAVGCTPSCQDLLLRPLLTPLPRSPLAPSSTTSVRASHASITNAPAGSTSTLPKPSLIATCASSLPEFPTAPLDAARQFQPPMRTLPPLLFSSFPDIVGHPCRLPQNQELFLYINTDA